MKETIAEVIAAGAFLVSPHHTDHPAVVEAAPQAEIIIDNANTMPTHCAQPESSSPVAIDSVPVQAAAFEMFDPNSLLFWIEAGGGGLGAGVIGSFLTSHGLRSSLRKNHEKISEDGRAAAGQLNLVLENAMQQANGLRDDDVPELRELIKKHTQTANRLFEALDNTSAEYDAERQRIFPSKYRLNEAQHTATVIKTAKTALKHAQKLQKELDRVQTDLSEIEDNITNATASVVALRSDLGALIEKGWDVSTYEERTAAFADSIAVARDKHAQHYLTEPVAIIKDTTEKTLDLQKEAATLEPRHAAAIEAHSAQPDRIVAAEATAVKIRERFATLGETYNPSCLAGFENVQDELAAALAALTSTHLNTGDNTGEHGKSVEAVQRSETFIAAFDEAFEQVQTMAAGLEERDKHLAILVKQLPRDITALSSRFERALALADDPDVKGKTADTIRSLVHDVADLRKGISTDQEPQPHYLSLEEHHLALAERLDVVHTAAVNQKQEMNNFRADIPQLIAGYNKLIQVMQDFSAGDVRLYMETRNSINQLEPYTHAVAADRKNLQRQDKYLREMLVYANDLLQQAQEEAGEDHPLVATAKLAGIALAIAGINVLDDM
ncbi:MAG TPA: hypothetical protein VLG11_00075 [Candidatus Saccharimonadales bacterium]|nr:hypothetical protein [Candidatus Saccharimonadales bacterium]